MFTVFALFIATCTAFAQQKPKPVDQSLSVTDSEKQAGNNFHSSFASSEFGFGGSVVVQGAPFSAVVTKETTQILSDGQRITRRMVASIYRDSLGRTRFEWGDGTKTPDAAHAPMIYDAASGTIYFVDPRTRRARPLLPPGKGAAPRQVKVITPQSPPENITQVVGETIEPLGTKMIEGVTAEGVRVTSTIPATASGGQSGKVVYERWYSQELRRNVLIKLTDPRFGEALFRLTNIDRSEPPGELFVISAESKSDASVGREREGPVSVKLERGGKVEVGNRTTGRITIMGWDRDFIEATATSERGAEAVRVKVTDDPSGQRIFLKADYANLDETDARSLSLEKQRAGLKARLQSLDERLESGKTRLSALEAEPKRAGFEERRKGILSNLEQLEETRREVERDLKELEARDSNPAPTPIPTPKIKTVATAPTIKPSPGVDSVKPPAPALPPQPAKIWPPASPPSPPIINGRPAEVNLEVKVPRYAEIDVISVSRSNVEVTNVETPIVISGDKSNVKLSGVGAAEVKTSSGDVVIENAAGLVDVITASGAIRVRNAGDVRALSISGPIEIQCARGRVDVSTTDGPIKLVGVGGDVDATTTNSEVRFTGAIREDGRYHLKSMSGYVEMTLPPNPMGFTAALSSYKGMVSTGFLLKTKLKMKQPLEVDASSASIPPPFSRRLIGLYGNGQAQITLDSFDGVVLLSKGAPGAIKTCQ
jgi:hypothetical protein